jgi:hypothetical protein
MQNPSKKGSKNVLGFGEKNSSERDFPFTFFVPFINWNWEGIRSCGFVSKIFLRG